MVSQQRFTAWLEAKQDTDIIKKNADEVLSYNGFFVLKVSTHQYDGISLFCVIKLFSYSENVNYGKLIRAIATLEYQTASYP